MEKIVFFWGWNYPFQAIGEDPQCKAQTVVFTSSQDQCRLEYEKGRLVKELGGTYLVQLSKILKQNFKIYQVFQGIGLGLVEFIRHLNQKEDLQRQSFYKILSGEILELTQYLIEKGIKTEIRMDKFGLKEYDEGCKFYKLKYFLTNQFQILHAHLSYLSDYYEKQIQKINRWLLRMLELNQIIKIDLSHFTDDHRSEATQRINRNFNCYQRDKSGHLSERKYANQKNRRYTRLSQQKPMQYNKQNSQSSRQKNTSIVTQTKKILISVQYNRGKTQKINKKPMRLLIKTQSEIQIQQHQLDSDSQKQTIIDRINLKNTNFYVNKVRQVKKKTRQLLNKHLKARKPFNQ